MTKQVRQSITPTHVLGSTGTAEGDDLGYRALDDLKSDMGLNLDDLAETWDDAGTTFTGIKLNVTDTASASDSLLMDLQVGGSSRVKVSPAGQIRCTRTTNNLYTSSGGQINLGEYESLISNWAIIGVANSGHYAGRQFSISLEYGALGIGIRQNINAVVVPTTQSIGFTQAIEYGGLEVGISYDAANTLAQRKGTSAQESRLYGSYTSGTAYQRLSTKTIREAITAASGASVTTTISIPKFSQLVGVTTRVTTALGETNGTTGYQVGDGSDADLWGDITGVAVGTTSDAEDFTAVAALGPSAADRTITLTAVGGNFDGTGVIEVCAYYLRAEAD